VAEKNNPQQVAVVNSEASLLVTTDVEKEKEEEEEDVERAEKILL
jgi:hypothetical protein